MGQNKKCKESRGCAPGVAPAAHCYCDDRQKEDENGNCVDLIGMDTGMDGGTVHAHQYRNVFTSISNLNITKIRKRIRITGGRGTVPFLTHTLVAEIGKQIQIYGIFQCPYLSCFNISRIKCSSHKGKI